MRDNFACCPETFFLLSYLSHEKSFPGWRAANRIGLFSLRGSGTAASLDLLVVFLCATVSGRAAQSASVNTSFSLWSKKNANVSDCVV